MEENFLDSFKGKIYWIELVTHLQCNCSCRVCPTARMLDNSAFSTDEMASWLANARKVGARGVWFGGGEPTLHHGLVNAVKTAKDLGYRNILLQTNGLRLAYDHYLERLSNAGLNMVSLSLKGADSQSHDYMTRVPGSFELLTEAAKNLVDEKIPINADILVTSHSVRHLRSMIELAADLETASVTLMLVSMHGLDRKEDHHWLPEPQLLSEHVEAAMDTALSLGLKITSLHIPPCLLAKRHRENYFHAGRYGLLVVPPSQEAFMAETSPTEGGNYLEQCQSCSERQDCLGFSSEYAQMKNLKNISVL